jgi:hypothetical protein
MKVSTKPEQDHKAVVRNIGFLRHFFSRVRTLAHKAAPAEPADLESKLFTFSTGSDRGYYLLCKFCTDRHNVSASPQAFRERTHIDKIAEKFVEAGWRSDNGLPVCPRCYKRKLKSGYYSADEKNA